ncbi:MAG TPA: magnesium transporter CorA family protein [Defluviicoccus sp.]|nr:magnesium transporter CorA family protein [Defluviicoccus sp.]
MLTVYSLSEGAIAAQCVLAETTLPERPLWVDLKEPTAAEEALVEAALAVDVPTPEEMREIETSSRLYREGAALVMTASILFNVETPVPETRAITFILVNGTLITVRYAEPQPFRIFPVWLQTRPELSASAEMTLVGLLDAIIDRLADALEMVDGTAGQLSKAVFAPLDKEIPRVRDYRRQLEEIGLNSIRCSKVDESLVGLSRLLTFLDANLRQTGNKEVRLRIKDLQRDALSLSAYVERLSEKLQLLLDATLGMINIRQNAIMQVFSVVAVVFMPPTLIASIYGMNFEVMPELSWPWGYPAALGCIVVSAILPYLLFKRRGWL